MNLLETVFPEACCARAAAGERNRDTLSGHAVTLSNSRREPGAASPKTLLVATWRRRFLRSRTFYPDIRQDWNLDLDLQWPGLGVPPRQSRICDLQSEQKSETPRVPIRSQSARRPQTARIGAKQQQRNSQDTVRFCLFPQVNESAPSSLTRKRSAVRARQRPPVKGLRTWDKRPSTVTDLVTASQLYADPTSS